MFKSRYIHCTRDAEKLSSMLKHGFLINPCKRQVLQHLTDRSEFKDKEPQEFGVVCLHNFNYIPNRKFCNKYGLFAIEMNPSFVKKSGFQRVEYLSYKGERFKQLTRQVEGAIRELDVLIQKVPEDSFRQMAYTNSHVAQLLGATKWVQFLKVFEYMEPVENKFENEWRYSSQMPIYNADSKMDMIRKINDPVSFAKYWNCLKFDRDDVICLYAPNDEIEKLRQSLSADFSGIEIRPTRLSTLPNFLNRL